MKLWGRRGLAAALGIIFSLGSGAASAQGSSGAQVVPSSFVLSAEVGPAASTPASTSAASMSAELRSAVVSTTTSVVSTATSLIASAAKPIAAFARPLAAATSQSMAASGNATLGQARFAQEATWLHNGGWPLYALVDRYSTDEAMNEEMTCLATAVYFEARGESVEGQLAVAKVVMNRAASGRYPPSLCQTVRQPAQFSFVRNGQFPGIDQGCQAWRRAKAVAKLAAANIFSSVPGDVLWYHADYVAPTWGQRMQRVEKIGAHIFYRA